MTMVTLRGNSFNTTASVPALGVMAPSFILTKTDLEDVNLEQLQGKKIILNIFPSVDTPTCSNSVRHFNQIAGEQPNTVVLCISMDLPFALNRFCGAENLKNVLPLSAFRHPEFGTADHYGVTLIDGPLKGLFSRAIVILDQNHKVIYTEQVSEITEEPNYDKALAALKV